jgi:hypothetical protein
MKEPNLESGKLTPTSLISDVVASGAELFHDQNNVPQIAFEGNGNIVSPIVSKTCRMWLNKCSYEKYGKVLSRSSMTQVLDTLAAMACFEGEQHTLYVRQAWVKEVLWYDLGSNAVAITKNGWSVSDTPPIIFKRFPQQQRQVIPKSGGDIALLLNYVNISDPQEKVLFIAHVISALIPGFAHPILIFSGPQGAGKSTPMKAMKLLIDPSEVNGTSTPISEAAFAQSVSHEAFVFYDNLSDMKPWFSDALSMAITGYAVTKRELYENDSDIVYSLQKVFALNGINQVVSRADLLDRSILLSLERISPDKRKSEDDFWGAFEQDRPKILGACFDILSTAIRLHQNNKLTDLPRMAAFTRWGYDIAEAVGLSGDDFIQAYDDNIDRQHDEAIDANPVAVAVVQFMQDHDDWLGTSSELYGFLETIVNNLHLASKNGWAGSAATLSKELRRLVPTLKERGVDVVFPKRGTQRTIQLTKTTDATDGTDSKKD